MKNIYIVLIVLSREVSITKARGTLTELEGAILGVLRRAEGMTAYAVRQVFLTSLSAEWSGSAGAVYPAIARLTAAKLLAAHAKGDGRGTTSLVLTATGRAAHDRWLCDVERAVGPGTDPFRTRAGLWMELTPTRRRSLMKALQKEIARQRGALKSEPLLPGEADAITRELHLALLEMRLRWLEQRKL